MSVVFVLLVNARCGVDEPENSETCGYELLSDAYDDYLDARNAYGMDPTPETCLALRAAVDDYESIAALIDLNCVQSNWDTEQTDDLRNWSQEIAFTVVPSDCSGIVPE